MIARAQTGLHPRRAGRRDQGRARRNRTQSRPI